MEDFRFVWEAIKGFMKDNVTSFASAVNRSRRLKTAELETCFTKLEKAQQNSFCAIRAGQLCRVKNELNALLRTDAEFQGPENIITLMAVDRHMS